MNFRLALLALPLALAACDAKSMADFRLPWDKPAPAPAAAAPAAPPAKPTIPEPTGASPLEQPLEVGGEAVKVATADAETVGVKDLTAGGEGWTVSVKGTSARFERPGAKSANVTVRRVPYARGLEYIGTLNDKPFVLNVTGADCGDRPMTAALKANGNSFAGCAAPAGAAAPVAKAEAPSAKAETPPAAKPAA